MSLDLPKRDLDEEKIVPLKYVFLLKTLFVCLFACSLIYLLEWQERERVEHE